jgi:hypothetical protein
MAKKKNNNDLLLGVAALGIGAYFLLSGDKSGGGSEGGSFIAPLVLTPSGEQALPYTVGGGSTGTSLVAFLPDYSGITKKEAFIPGKAPYVEAAWAGIQAEQKSFLSSLPGQANKPPTLAQATTNEGLIWHPITKKESSIVRTNLGGNIAPVYGSGF